jgi:cyclic-di-AMP phosphodiesterase PgpH
MKPLREWMGGFHKARSRRQERVSSSSPAAERPEASQPAFRHPLTLLAMGVGVTLLIAALLVDVHELDPRRVAGALLVAALMNAIFGMYLISFRRAVLRRRSRLALVCLLALIVIGCAALAASPNADWPPYLVPITGASIILAVVFDRRISLELSWMLLIYTGVILVSRQSLGGREVIRTLGVLVAGMLTAVLTTGRIRTRSRIIQIGALIGVVHFMAISGFFLLWPDSRPGDGSVLLTHLLAGLGQGVLVGFVVSGSLPLLEYLFGISTDISLLELSNIAQQTVLRRLLIAAPGTYNHSFIVGMLAEEAAEAIGANPLLARVGGYYHDIGKMMKPEYYGENEVIPGTHHKPLSPTMSTLIIKSHVKDGVELARHHDLPRPILEIIEQHHGTTLVEFFYDKAVRRARERERVEESAFRYEGPKPQSREAGIVMLADSVEAATRSLSEPNPARIENTIRRISEKKLADGQLDECGLSLKEVRRIEDSFIRVLAGIFHKRPRYPEIVHSPSVGPQRSDPAAI